MDTLDPATEGAWLRVVVKHEAMAIRRARLDSVERDDVDLDENIHGGLREVDDAVAGGERVERSVEALRALKPDEARALLLKAEGLSYQEIGRRFGWSYTKVNRSITEGRARFLKTYSGIEAGEECERHSETLTALAAGAATSAQVVAIRPHLRHCATCRATVRDMRFSRSRRLALLLPFGWLARLLSRSRRHDHDVRRLQRRRATRAGGGDVGLCLSGVGAGAACVMTRRAAGAADHRPHHRGAEEEGRGAEEEGRQGQEAREGGPGRRAALGPAPVHAATPTATATPKPRTPKAKVARKRRRRPSRRRRPRRPRASSASRASGGSPPSGRRRRVQGGWRAPPASAAAEAVAAAGRPARRRRARRATSSASRAAEYPRLSWGAHGCSVSCSCC